MMAAHKFKYLYGPVHSWRLGVSLGIDPVCCSEKICNLDCVYCQLGKTDLLTSERSVYVPTEEIVKEITSLPNMHLDYLTFSGRGEPTLAKNLGEMILALRAIRQAKIAVITNSVLMDRPEVRKELALADFVLAKIDACGPQTFACINRPLQAEHFGAMIDGLKEFKKGFFGKMALQIMFIPPNQALAKEMASIARNIAPDEIEINTPLRPSAVKPLTEKELLEIKKAFTGLPVKTVYEAERQPYKPLNEQDTVRRHGRYQESV